MEGRSAILVVSVFLFSGVAQFARAADTEERKLGFHTDMKVQRTHTLVLNGALNRRVNEIGERVVKASDKPEIRYTFRVLNDANINAYSAAGGFVYVNTGLLDILESEEELAAVMAHEIGHVSKSHHLRFLRSKQKSEVMGSIVGGSIGIGLSAAAGAAVRPSSSGNRFANALATNLALQYGQSIGSEMAVSMITGYGRQQELEADALAIRYVHEAGYDPNAMVSVLKKLASVRDKLQLNQANYISSLINAQPGLNERIKEAEALIAAPQQEATGKKQKEKKS